MRLPNGYGSIVKVSGRRRKPYRVRKTVGWEVIPGTEKVKRKFINIGDFETKAGKSAVPPPSLQIPLSLQSKPVRHPYSCPRLIEQDSRSPRLSAGIWYKFPLQRTRTAVRLKKKIPETVVVSRSKKSKRNRPARPTWHIPACTVLTAHITPYPSGRFR